MAEKRPRGTELQNRGLAVGEHPDLWNLEHPERVAELARAYVEAGSRVILTNTFRSNRIALAPTGHAQHTEEINRAGCTLSLWLRGLAFLRLLGFSPGVWRQKFG